MMGGKGGGGGKGRKGGVSEEHLLNAPFCCREHVHVCQHPSPAAVASTGAGQHVDRLSCHGQGGPVPLSAATIPDDAQASKGLIN
eukprot:scaffold25527_cov31-Tisochrysis_lutea.AAC.2